MEITRRNDIGADLKAPVAARGGASTPGYALVSVLGIGDIALHYDGNAEAIVGASLVTGPAEPAAIYWVARGSYARRAGARPKWHEESRVPLGRFIPLDPPLALARIRAQQSAILQIRADIVANAQGQPIYFPWVPYGTGPIRTFQSYLVKVPRAVVDLFPQLRAAVDALGQPDTTNPRAAPELLADEVAAAAGRTGGTRRGQGYLADQALRAAVESLAMNAATDHYAAEWIVEDVHATESYDLHCTRGSLVKHVEVKGTTTGGDEVILTPNEVAHVRSTPDTALFVLRGIHAIGRADGSVDVSGGTPTIVDPWQIEDDALTPVGYRYTIPDSARADHRGRCESSI